MSGYLTVVIGLSFVFGLNAAIARAADSRVHGSASDYRAMKESCTGIAEAGRAQCRKEAKGKDKVKHQDALWRCEDVTSREERECIVRELERQHADIREPGQGGNTHPMGPVLQPR